MAKGPEKDPQKAMSEEIPVCPHPDESRLPAQPGTKSKGCRRTSGWGRQAGKYTRPAVQIESSPVCRKGGFSRRQFLKAAGVGTIGLCLNTFGLKGIVYGQGSDIDGPGDGGSLIGAVRLNPASAYGDIPALLEKHIQEKDDTAWRQIKQRIDYTYDNLGHALWPVLREEDLEDRIKGEINSGKKLFFKPNLVNPEALSLSGDGSPGLTTGLVAATNWTFIAALMRFFHEKLGIAYYQMALGEAGAMIPSHSALVNCPPEALMEGCGFPLPDGTTYWAGWPFYFIRKYLAETTTPLDSHDNPMNGYLDGITGNHLTPGEATRKGKLMVYDLNNAERFDRGRSVPVPDGGDNYKEGIIIHKALIGDPNDPDNYPGSVLINCPVLKVHALTVITNAIKNLGIGGWPMCAGHDHDPGTHDWAYAYPHAYPSGIKGGVPGGEKKGGVYHARWYVEEANEEGMPLRITRAPNSGLDGTMVDINLALKSQVPCILHIVDSIQAINIDHSGGGTGVAQDEGLIFASKDPVALDLLCSRYMFKNVPRSSLAPTRFLRSVPVPWYNKARKSIVTRLGVDSRLSRSTLFGYSAGRGLGKLCYYVKGADTAASKPSRLASKDGHLGRIEQGKFEDIMTREFYFSQLNTLWDLQTTVLAYARATDALTQAAYGYNPGYSDEFMSLDENGDGVIDDLELGREGGWDCFLSVAGIGSHLAGKGEIHHSDFFIYSRMLKYANKAWNIDTTGLEARHVESLKVFLDSLAVAVALALATGPEGMDPFFQITYGTGRRGIPKWPSLQFARYGFEMSIIHDHLYANAKAFSEATGREFILFVPDSVPYFSPAAYNPEGIPDIREISSREFLPNGEQNPKYDPDFSAKVFTARFQNGEVW
ncbi:MAG: DUF362 domain-containing protein [bacterium]